jgi:SMC interacting uncharacterized protein involved in chromosome segregation
MEALDAKQTGAKGTQGHELGSKGIEDINREMKGFVGELSDKKVKAEDAVQNLKHKEEDFIEDAKNQINTSIFELNNKRINLERTVNSKLDLASESLKKSVELLKQSYAWLMGEYRKSLMIPLATLIFIVFFYDSVTTHIPHMSPLILYNTNKNQPLWNIQVETLITSA